MSTEDSVMQNVTFNKDRTVRLSGTDHYRLKLLSLNTGISVKQLITYAVPLLNTRYLPKSRDTSHGVLLSERAEIDG
jgi:hypothetical protein